MTTYKEFHDKWWKTLTFWEKVHCHIIHFFGSIEVRYWIIRTKLGFPYIDKEE